MLKLSRLAIISEALPCYIIPLISAAINVKFLNTGNQTTCMDDDCFQDIFRQNKLQKLEELRIMRSSGLTINIAYQLIHNRYVCTLYY